MRILIFGSKGQVGSCLRDQCSHTDYEIIYSSREDMDIGNLTATFKYIIDCHPDVVINVAAYTDVDAAEQNPEAAELINHKAVSNLAESCKCIDAWLIQLSSNYVFDGNSARPYVESDPPSAQGSYAISKLSGEDAVKISGCKHLIIRTAWVFSEHGTNFLKTMLIHAKKNDRLSLVADQIGCPTYGQDIAKAVLKCVIEIQKDRCPSGIYHFCGSDACSWLQFAEMIFSRAEAYGWHVPKKLLSVRAIDYSTAAYRPAYGVLDCSKFFSTFDVSVPDFPKGIEHTFEALGSPRF